MSLAERLQRQRDEAANVPKHVLVKALAGTGKTFTQIVGVAYAFARSHWSEIVETISAKTGVPAAKIVPSKEQMAVWQAMEESAQAGAMTIGYCAYNKSIVTEFSAKWGWLVRLLRQRKNVALTFSTINAMGYRAYCQVHPGKIECSDDLFDVLYEQVTLKDVRRFRQVYPERYTATRQLWSSVKTSLAGWDGETFDPRNVENDILHRLVCHYDLELDYDDEEETFHLVRAILEENTKAERLISFDDQNWLCIIRGYSIPRHDLLMVDEAQDLNQVKQEFACRSGRRLIVVGDENQAIYGFAGADPESMNRMATKLRIDKVLTLNETRRCGHAIVREAQRYVPQFRAFPENPKGKVSTVQIDDRCLSHLITDGDMILCRINAVLVTIALSLVRQGKKVSIRGRNFGTSLANFVRRFHATSVSNLLDKSREWTRLEVEKEMGLKSPNETRIQTIQDRFLCVEAFSEGAESVDVVISRIQKLFAGRQCPSCRRDYEETVTECFQCGANTILPQGAILSSIHRAKGLESKRVFWVRTKEVESIVSRVKLPWQRRQEMNLAFVATTRAIEQLIYVVDPPNEEDWNNR